ncbi:MAG: hypothetical protein REH79_02570 [Spiroplasma sp.]|nr:hypothetical protein [Spiroplasma sp.]
MVNKVNKSKDLWFYYKVITTVLILSAVLGVYLYHMITRTWVRASDYPFNYWLFQGNFFSYFTYQSNIIVGVWFLIAAIYHNKPNKIIDNQNVRLAITCYISVTCFIFLIVLMPGLFFFEDSISFFEIFGLLFFHVFSPILMIVYTLTHVVPMKMKASQYYQKSFWLYLLYPVGYTLFLVIRLIVYSNISTLKNVPLVLVYPYLPILPTEDIGTIITNSHLIVFLMTVFFVVVYIAFIAFNFIYFFSIKKIAGNQKKARKKASSY